MDPGPGVGLARTRPGAGGSSSPARSRGRRRRAAAPVTRADLRKNRPSRAHTRSPRGQSPDIMASVERVEDPEDPRLHDYREIRDAERRRISGTFIAEGRTVVRRLLDAQRYRARSALVTPPALEALGDALGQAGVRTYLVRQDIVKAIVGIEFHHGCLAVGERGDEPVVEAVLAEARGRSVV